MNEKPLMTEKEKIASSLTGAGDGIIVDMSGRTAGDVMRDEAVKKINKEMEVYADAFNKHTEALEESVNKLSLNPEDVEIMPIGNYVLVKEFKTNPFQRIVRDSNGIITDLGGMAPIFKNTDNGKIEEEEQFIITGAIQEVGPECKWLKPGDAVFFMKPAMIPVPFYKSGLVVINENKIIAVVNEGLSKRFNRI